VAGLAGVMYTPINSPNYHMGMDFLVLSFVVVVVGGMGSLPGAVLAGFLLGILESFASMAQVSTCPASTRSSSTSLPSSSCSPVRVA
jgi:branched-chain amino acid transport system permease protein